MTLVEFLINTGRYDRFIANVKLQNREEVAEISIARVQRNELFLSGAFNWEESNEGHDYWKQANNEFKLVRSL